MEYFDHEEIASVILYDLRLSEGELMIYEGCIDYVLKHCTDEQICEIAGCEDKEELTIFKNELRELIKKYVWPQYLPDKYKNES
ncbi:hypothetical protein [Marininema halotolerans]|uniref:Uncharacterized protein n=1 Tax=Marininema halotolerans TaxID=1155944 RepID=A0A1I6PZZ7_9BACL|nr:hypothetical protein [Marininema halotolerans]SFS45791.1 hypothetical protein SAMN05444972_102250 [Marininema halotolerans]